ncbi:type VI secretion system contractile sheath domain-containing protein [Limnoglobus roseus]|uniref:type VI secretion system contractile sheath domain-containing protein n=1 Tax=Limnoglobus roseus TaxID=2598579 RepID=UPI00143D9159|nr:type VI secretion system contractile sheath large subunit [Limnoglobus roseus]
MPAPTDPFRLAVLGDFSGRGGDFESAKPVLLNLEDFEATIAKLNPTVPLDGLPGDPSLTIQSLDDFEPDAVVRAVDHFTDLSDEDEKAEFLDSVLRHPNLRRAEGVWRGVDWLARRGRKSGRQIEVVLYDVSADNFATALSGDELSESVVYKALVADAVFGKKGKPWAAVMGLYDYDFTAAHAELLGRAARTLTDCGGPFLAGVSTTATDSATAIDEADAEAWAELRALPEAGLIGLATPRFLARRPYGEDFRPPEAFPYEEFKRDAVSESYVWAPAVFIPAGVLAQGYVADGWGFGAQKTRVLEGMTTHAYTDADDDDHLTLLDCWLDRKAAERLTGLGVMTALAVKSADSCQLTRLHSLGAGTPPADLYGRWGKSASAGPPRGRFGVSVVMDSEMTGTAPKRASGAAASSESSSESSASSETSESFASSDDSSSLSSDSDSPSSGGDDLAAMMAALDSPPADAPSDGADDIAAMMAALDAPVDDAPPPADAPDQSIEDMLKQLEDS